MLAKCFKKTLLPLCLSAVLTLGLCPNLPVRAAAPSTYTGSNIEAQTYLRWSKPVQSYLTALADGSLMRVQAGGTIPGILVEFYDSSYRLTSSNIIPEELPIFGGFYAGEKGYFLVTGQENNGESAAVPSFRITKYDKKWNRLGCAELKNCNTTVPFDAGSVRMDACGKYLLIRTSHEMYRTSDGLNHQANLTIELDMDALKITDSYSDIGTYFVGYVSHSFNQFIKIENNRIVSLDHGDTYPRSLVLLKYPTDVSTGNFRPSWFKCCTAIPMMEFAGEPGQNTTGAAVGGFEISSSSYLAAGHSVKQDSRFLNRRTRNVFVAAADKATSRVSVNWLTSYEEGDGTTSTPQMVRLSDKEFVVLWSREEHIYYTKVNDKGIRISDIYTQTGHLSDCAPILANGKILWYTWDDSKVQFFEISQQDLSRCVMYTPETGSNSANTTDPSSKETEGSDHRQDSSQQSPTGSNKTTAAKGTAVSTPKGTFKVTKTGGNQKAEAAFTASAHSAKSVSIPATVTIRGVSCKVTSIAPKALRHDKKLTKVTIGKNVKVIGKDAFNGCKKLKTILIKSSSLKKVEKNAIRGISRKAVIRVPKKKRKAYKKLFKPSTGLKRTMKI